MNKRANLAAVGLFGFVIVAMTITLVLFIGDRTFSGKEEQRFELLFDSSVKGLNVGAPVTLRGVKIGEVVSVRTKLYGKHQGLLNSVVIAIYLDSIVLEGYDESSGKLINLLVKNRLAAKLGLQSVLTGLLYVEVDMLESPPAPLHLTTEYPQIPTVQGNLEAIIQKFESIDISELAENASLVLENLATLTSSDELLNLVRVASGAFEGMDYMASSTSESMAGIRGEFAEIATSIAELKKMVAGELPMVTGQLNRTLAEMQNSMVKIQETLTVVEDSMASDSPMLYQLEQSARDFSRASRAIEELAATLDQQPSSLFFGKRVLGNEE